MGTILDFPSEGSDPSVLEIAPPCKKQENLKRKSDPRVKFDSVVRVKNILSRHELTPQERFNYWCGGDNFSDKVLKAMTEKWHKEEAVRRESEESISTMPRQCGMPVVPDIKQLLPSSEREGHDGY